MFSEKPASMPSKIYRIRGCSTAIASKISKVVARRINALAYSTEWPTTRVSVNYTPARVVKSFDTARSERSPNHDTPSPEVLNAIS